MSKLIPSADGCIKSAEGQEQYLPDNTYWPVARLIELPAIPDENSQKQPRKHWEFMGLYILALLRGLLNRISWSVGTFYLPLWSRDDRRHSWQCPLSNSIARYLNGQVGGCLLSIRAFQTKLRSWARQHLSQQQPVCHWIWVPTSFTAYKRIKKEVFLTPLHANGQAKQPLSCICFFATCSW